jgi:hypothetical protein
MPLLLCYKLLFSCENSPLLRFPFTCVIKDLFYYAARDVKGFFYFEVVIVVIFPSLVLKMIFLAKKSESY